MRVLITGLRGFTGRYVAEEFEAAGWEVWGLGRRQAADVARYRAVSLSDVDGLRAYVCEVRPSAVVHLAGIASVAHDDGNALYQVNLLGTRNLLSALAECAVRPECVVLASSAHVYGDSIAGMLTESAPPLPANDYGVSKLAMEHMARQWLDRLPVVIARPFNYTGAGHSERFLFPKILAHFRDRAPCIELGNLDVARDFSDVRMIARAYRRIVEARPVGETFNLCSGRANSIHEILDIASDITGHSLQVNVNPAFVRQGEVRRLWGDPSRLAGLLGEWPPPSLERTARWMLGVE